MTDFRYQNLIIMKVRIDHCLFLTAHWFPCVN